MPKAFMSLGFENYADYLASPLWRKIRAQVLSSSHSTCQCCGAHATQVHHFSYDLQYMDGSDSKALIPICESCHHKASVSRKGNKMPLYAANWRIYQAMAEFGSVMVSQIAIVMGYTYVKHPKIKKPSFKNIKAQKKKRRVAEKKRKRDLLAAEKRKQEIYAKQRRQRNGNLGSANAPHRNVRIK